MTENGQLREVCMLLPVASINSRFCYYIVSLAAELAALS
jgi:hypothetical protein